MRDGLSHMRGTFRALQLEAGQLDGERASRRTPYRFDKPRHERKERLEHQAVCAKLHDPQVERPKILLIRKVDVARHKHVEVMGDGIPEQIAVRLPLPSESSHVIHL